MTLTDSQIRAIHSKRWNSASPSQRQVLLTKAGFGQTAGIRGTMTPLINRNYKDLPTEFKDQLVLGHGDI
jgi:hypothetical protein